MKDLSRRKIVKGGVLGSFGVVGAAAMAGCGETITVTKEVIKEVPVEKVITVKEEVPVEVEVIKIVEAAPAPKGPRQTVELWSGFDPKTHGQVGLVYDAIIDIFNAGNPDHVVDHVVQPWGQIIPKVLTSVAAGNPPDVFRNWFTTLGVTASANVIQTVEPYIKRDTAWDADDFLEGPMSQTYFKGQRMAVPLSGIVALMYVNKDMAGEMGVTIPAELPQSLDAMEEIGAELYDVSDDGTINKVGFAPTLFSSPMLWAAVWGNDNAYDEASNTFDGNTTEMKQLLEWHKSYGDTYGGEEIVAWKGTYGVGNYGRFTSDGPLYTNQVGMAGLSSWWFSDIGKQAPDQNYAFDKVQAPAAGNNYRSSDLNTNIYSIPTGAKNPDGGWAWGAFLTGPEQMRRKTIADAVPAIRKSLDTPSYHQASAINGACMSKVFPNTWKLPSFGSYGEFRKNLGTLTESVLLGQKSIDEAITEMTDAVNADIEAKS